MISDLKFYEFEIWNIISVSENERLLFKLLQDVAKAHNETLYEVDQKAKDLYEQFIKTSQDSGSNPLSCRSYSFDPKVSFVSLLSIAGDAYNCIGSSISMAEVQWALTASIREDVKVRYESMLSDINNSVALLPFEKENLMELVKKYYYNRFQHLFDHEENFGGYWNWTYLPGSGRPRAIHPDYLEYIYKYGEFDYSASIPFVKTSERQ